LRQSVGLQPLTTAFHYYRHGCLLGKETKYWPILVSKLSKQLHLNVIFQYCERMKMTVVAETSV